MVKNILFLCCISLSGLSQGIYKGFGIFGALTQSAHYYKNPDNARKESDTGYIYSHFYPPTHISREFFNWGAGLFLELSGRDDIRWQTELEYANKGAREMDQDPVTQVRTGAYVPNKYTYIQWNNYAKFYNPIGNAHWYIMPGVRLEYLFKKSTPAFLPFSGQFPTFWFSGDVGLGYEFPLFKKYSAFIEYHWNPDVISHKHDNTKIRNRTFELRVGLVMRPRKRRIDDCNAPAYRGPAY
jgi:hypothetical protein